MITDQEIKKLYEAGEIQKATLKNAANQDFDIYFYQLDHKPTYNEIKEKHKISYCFSEWLDFYRDRELLIQERLGKKNTIPLTSLETCVRYGL